MCTLAQVEKTSDGKWTAAATAIVRVSLKNGVGHEDVGNAHLKDKDKGEVLEKTKKVVNAFFYLYLFFPAISYHTKTDFTI